MRSAAFETFIEFLPKFGKSSFLPPLSRGETLSGIKAFQAFLDSRFRGNDKEGSFSKLSLYDLRSCIPAGRSSLSSP
jgi:hypothetical protein